MTLRILFTLLIVTLFIFPNIMSIGSNPYSIIISNSVVIGYITWQYHVYRKLYEKSRELDKGLIDQFVHDYVDENDVNPDIINWNRLTELTLSHRFAHTISCWFRAKRKLLMLIPLVVFTNIVVPAQSYTWKDAFKAVKKSVPSASLSFVSGMSTGLNQTLVHHYDRFEQKFPNVNHQWFNPKWSWYNKYEDNDPSKGPKYFGSTTFLVPLTDAYHFTNFVSRGSLFSAGVTLTLGSDKNKKFSHRIIDLGIGIATNYIAHSIGFELVYGQIFKK